jgi:hypothetical protein
MDDKALPPELAILAASLQGQGPSVPEGLLLLKAFVSIKDPSMRASIVDLVDKIAHAAKA